MMRSLGYPNVISMEAFRTPNFELVAELLYWMVKRYDPDAMISDEIGTETERVRFLKAVGTLMHGKARVKLSLRRLYASDGLAVKEMLKIASILYQASAQTVQEDDEDSELDGFNLGPKSFDAKLTRQLASEITLSGAKIFDGLKREPELQVARNAAIHRNMDLDQIEAAVQEAIQQVKDNVVQVEQHTADMEKDKKNLEAKIEKRKAELDRSEKRLNTLQSVRPAYMDEYEKLQGKLQDLYVEYLEKFRNLEFLEDRLEARRQREQQRAEESERRMKKMQKRLKEEELRILRGEAAVDGSDVEAEDDDDDDDLDEPEAGGLKKVTRLQASAGPAVRETNWGGQVMGSLDGDDDLDGSDGSDLEGASAATDSTHISINDGEEDDLDSDEYDLDREDDEDILGDDEDFSDATDNEF